MASAAGQKVLVSIPQEYLDAMSIGNALFPPLYQYENGLRLAIDKYLSTCYGKDWWDISLKKSLPDIWDYSDKVRVRQASMPWIGASTKIKVIPIHLVTLGHLEEIIKKYRSDCIPQLFPTMEYFLGHMEVVKRVRNLYTHMFPCLTEDDCDIAEGEIKALAKHLNTRL